MNLKSVAIGSVLILTLLISAITYLAAVNTKYNGDLNTTSFEKTNERLRNITTISKTAYDATKTESVLESGITSSYAIIKLGIKTIRLLWNIFVIFIFDIPTDTCNAIAQASIGVDCNDWVTLSISTILILLLVITIVSIALRWNV